ncbi:TRAP transporter small permease [Siccirubricoccus sp. KC 17139]|uniref:TRAP transporter small permease protein n=1 Tax=Siccirubricoccus soli TaxID=2899147 RepID=A0ABT1DD88_9PROT|nr:TRAP transporter small permease [Siccirubricoccus soli]MCP2685320.1 TRAP transporter small permease [Siccirubricoccus soli]
MERLHRGVSVALEVAARLAILIAGLAMVAMTVVVAWGVFGRFVLNDTPAWAEASALLLMAWVIMGAAAAGVREGFHMGFETLREALPAPVARLFLMLSDATITLFGAAMFWYGLDLALTVWDATLPTVGLPGTVEYLPLVLGGVLITLFGLERLLSHAATGHAPAGVPEHTILTDS